MIPFLILNLIVAIGHFIYFRKWKAKSHSNNIWDYLEYISDGHIVGEVLYLFTALIIIFWFIVIIFGTGYWIAN